MGGGDGGGGSAGRGRWVRCVGNGGGKEDSRDGKGEGEMGLEQANAISEDHMFDEA